MTWGGEKRYMAICSCGAPIVASTATFSVEQGHKCNACKKAGREEIQAAMRNLAARRRKQRGGS